MAVYQLLSQFTDGAGAGFSEQFFVKRADARTQAQLQAIMAEYWPIRQALMDSEYYLTEMRMSDVNIYRDSTLLTGFGGSQLQGAIVSPNNNGEEVFTRLLIRLEATALHRRAFEMGCIPDGVLTARRIYTGYAAWYRKINAWIKWMVANAALHLKGSVDGRPASDTILSYAVNPSNTKQVNVTLSGFVTAGYAAGNLVRISRAKFSLNLEGVWRIRDVEAAVPPAGLTLVLEPRRYPVIVSSSTQPGFITVVHGAADADFVPVTNAIPERGVQRKSGRPFGEPRGRQSHQG